MGLDVIQLAMELLLVGIVQEDQQHRQLFAACVETEKSLDTKLVMTELMIPKDVILHVQVMLQDGTVQEDLPLLPLIVLIFAETGCW